jgi:hypothetical protein
MQVIGHNDPCKRFDNTAIGCRPHFGNDQTRKTKILEDLLTLAGYGGNKVGTAGL